MRPIPSFCALLLATSVPLPAAPWFDGGDLSAAGEMERLGGRFRDRAGEASDPVRALAGFGANCVRLRLFVAPNGKDFVVNDLDHTLALARRARAARQAILLDFHYSDTWADPGNQRIPAAWSDHSLDALAGRVEAHTAATLEAFRKAGLQPALVQIGNEIDHGMLWPTGKVWKEKDGQPDWDSLATLLKAAAKGVRRVPSPDGRVRIVLHSATGGHVRKTADFHQAMRERGLDYDVAGLSYYPWWHGTLADLRRNVAQLATTFGKEVMVVEAAYPWTEEWAPKAKAPSVWAWPKTPDGQARFLRDVIDAVAQAPGDKGIGVLWWHPDSVPIPGTPVWMGGSCALWRADGSPLPAVEAFRTR